jgi:hypothetical protein
VYQANDFPHFLVHFHTCVYINNNQLVNLYPGEVARVEAYLVIIDINFKKKKTSKPTSPG